MYVVMEEENVIIFLNQMMEQLDIINVFVIVLILVLIVSNVLKVIKNLNKNVQQKIA